MSKQTDLINIPDAITVSGSNVGIGTSSPSRQLEIYDDGTVGQAVLALTAQNTEPSRIMFADPDDVNIGILDYHHSDNSMRFIVNNAERMRIDSSGNVVIGANPSTSLGAGDNTAYIGADGEIQIRRAAGTGRNMMKFRNGSNHVGSITTDANKVSLLSLSGDLILDASGIINLDADNGGNINLKDGGTHYGTIQNENSDLRINSIIQDKDIIFRGNDGGTGINALTLDMSDGGAAKFGAGGYNNTKGVTVFGSQGQIWVASENATGGYFNRKSSDGVAITLARDDSNKGFIGVNNGDPYIARNSGNGMRWYNGAVVPTNDAGDNSDNTMDLGATNSRFKNLYLSGNVTAVGMSTFSDITIGKVTDGQALIQMIANPTNGANTIHFGDAATGAAAFDGYIQFSHDSRTMQFGVGSTESMRILRDDGTGDGAVKIKGGLGLHFSNSYDASQYMMGVGTDNSYRSGVIFELQTSQGLWACGFIKIKCAAGRNGLESRSTAEYLYKFQAFNEGISGIGLVSSAGNTGDFTISVTEANANSSAGTVELKVKSPASTNHGTSMTHVEVGYYSGINKLRRGI